MGNPYEEKRKTAKLTLKYVRCELNESNTLQEAKARVDELLWLLNTALDL
jgi:hypothetical protein